MKQALSGRKFMYGGDKVEDINAWVDMCHNWTEATVDDDLDDMPSEPQASSSNAVTPTRPAPVAREQVGSSAKRAKRE